MTGIFSAIPEASPSPRQVGPAYGEPPAAPAPALTQPATPQPQSKGQPASARAPEPGMWDSMSQAPSDPPPQGMWDSAGIPGREDELPAPPSESTWGAVSGWISRQIKAQAEDVMNFAKMEVMGGGGTLGVNAYGMGQYAATSTDQEKRSAVRGGALIASILATEGLSSLFEASLAKAGAGTMLGRFAERRLLAKATSLYTSSTVGGLTYGAIAPTDPGESRLDNMLEYARDYDVGATVWAPVSKVLGTVAGRLARPLIGQLLKLSSKDQGAVGDIAGKYAEQLIQHIREQGGFPESMTNTQRDGAASVVLKHALEDLQEPNAVMTDLPEGPAPEASPAASTVASTAAPTSLAVEGPPAYLNDENGQPLKLYHGTGQVFDEFQQAPAVSPGHIGVMGRGTYVSESPEVASAYAGGETPNVHQVAVKAGNYIDADEPISETDYSRLMDKVKELEPEAYAKSDQVTPWHKYMDWNSALTKAERIIPESGDESQSAQDLTGVLQQLGYDGIKHLHNLVDNAVDEEGGFGPHDFLVFNEKHIEPYWSASLAHDIISADSPVGARAAMANAGANAAETDVGQRDISTQRVQDLAQSTISAPNTEQTVEDVISKNLDNPDTEKVLTELYSVDPSIRDLDAPPDASADKSLLKSLERPTKIMLNDENPIGDVAPDFHSVVGTLARNLPDSPLAMLAGMSDDILKRVEDGKVVGLKSPTPAADMGKLLASGFGALPRQFATRLTMGAGAAALATASVGTDDEKSKALLRAGAAFLALGALYPGNDAYGAWVKNLGVSKKLLRWLNLRAVLSAGGKEGADMYNEMVNVWGYHARDAAKRMGPELLPDDASRTAFRQVIMNGIEHEPVAYNMLNDAQRKAAQVELDFTHNMENLGQAAGVSDAYKRSFISRVVPKETLDAWRLENPQGEATIDKLREFSDRRGMTGPETDPAKLQAIRVLAMGRMLANKGIVDLFNKLGYIQDVPTDEIPEGWRRVQVTGLDPQRPMAAGVKMAPEAEATLLERLSGQGSKLYDHEVVRALDAVKAEYMKAVMYWGWSHGINIYKGALALDGTGAGYRMAYKTLQDGAPSVAEAAKWADIFGKPDFAEQASKAFEGLRQKLNWGPLGENGWLYRLHKWGEQKLWEKQVPALGIAAFWHQMDSWTRRTGGEFAIGSPEYVEAARAAGQFANNVMGKLPSYMTDPTVAYGLRQLMFSPSFTRTRMALTANAAGEFYKVLSGEMNPRDVMYLPYMARKLLMASALTYGLSKALTGNDPVYNQNTGKFYARTGMYDGTGHEQGIDLTGWWQDDIKMLGSPLTYLRSRKNPVYSSVEGLINGTDPFGRKIDVIDRIGNSITPEGPASGLIEGLARMYATGQVRDADIAKVLSGTLAIGSVTAMPKPIDVMITRMARRVLIQQGLPFDDDHVWELSRIMRQDFEQQGSPVGENVIHWIGATRMSYRQNDALGYGAHQLWRHVYGGLRSVARDNVDEPAQELFKAETVRKMRIDAPELPDALEAAEKALDTAKGEP